MQPHGETVEPWLDIRTLHTPQVINKILIIYVLGAYWRSTGAIFWDGSNYYHCGSRTFWEVDNSASFPVSLSLPRCPKTQTLYQARLPIRTIPDTSHRPSIKLGYLLGQAQIQDTDPLSS